MSSGSSNDCTDAANTDPIEHQLVFNTRRVNVDKSPELLGTYSHIR